MTTDGIEELRNTVEQIRATEFSDLPAQLVIGILAIEALHLEEVATLRLDFNAIYHLAMQDEDEAVRRQAIESTVKMTVSGCSKGY